MKQKVKCVSVLQALFFIVVFCAFAPAGDVVKILPNRSFYSGEHIEYRVHYGFITAGEAEMNVVNSTETVNNRPCHKLEVVGRTAGAFDKMLKIRDTWGAYMDTATYVTYKNYRRIEEGNYRRNEQINLDYKNQKGTIVVNNDAPKDLKLPGYVYDMVSGYYFLRLLDYNSLREGQIISINGMLEDKFYNFKIKYVGKERIKTKYGRTNAIFLAPILPENKLFNGENAIKFYISDDANRIPLKIRAELYVGAVELDIKGYNNLRYPLKFD